MDRRSEDMTPDGSASKSAGRQTQKASRRFSERASFDGLVTQRRTALSGMSSFVANCGTIERRDENFEDDNYDLTKPGIDAPTLKNQFYGVIEKDPCLLLAGRNVQLLIERFTVGHKHPVFKNISVYDDALKTYVYKKSLEGLLHPSSSNAHHEMANWTGASLTRCQECGGLLVGSCNVVTCRKCKLKVHSKCEKLLYNECPQKDTHEVDACETIEMKQKDKKEALETLRKAFKVDPESHAKHTHETKRAIVAPSYSWFAKITIRVLCARGLAAKDSLGNSDPYVTLQLGNATKKTKVVRKNLNPSWDETFHFECHSSRDRIKVRVWDKDDCGNFVKDLFKVSTDDFLGQTIIDVKRVIGESDLWYTLEKRSERSEVSGSIRLEIKALVPGEEIRFNRHIQYSCLHESIFGDFVRDEGPIDAFPVTPFGERLNVAEDWKNYFDGNSQEILDEFAKRYEIESLFRAMVHFSCLCERYPQQGVLLKLKNLLEGIKCSLEECKTPSLMSMGDRISACNFGKWNFMKILDRLSTCLKITLSQYRDFYPSKSTPKLFDLSNSIDLLIKIMSFKAEFQEIPNGNRASLVLMDCIKSCMESTYMNLFTRCCDIHQSLFPNAGEEDQTEEGPGCKRNLGFWLKLVALIASTIDEDCKIYSHLINRFPEVFSLEHLSSSILWNLFRQDLKEVLEGRESFMFCTE